VQVQHGVITLTMLENGEVVVDMGQPVFDPRRVPFDSKGLEGRREGADTLWPLDLDGLEGGRRWISAVSMGNPHAVQVVADVDAVPVAVQGPLIEHDPRFPQHVNAGYMQVMDRANIRLRVWERGARETLSCGTGACAAVVAGIRRGLLDHVVRVETRGGALTVAWPCADAAVTMTGPAATVFEGEWEVSAG
jgi:diaminopimelate epimerase